MGSEAEKDTSAEPGNFLNNGVLSTSKYHQKTLSGAGWQIAQIACDITLSCEVCWSGCESSFMSHSHCFDKIAKLLSNDPPVIFSFDRLAAITAQGLSQPGVLQ